jgi:hypothetical protein
LAARAARAARAAGAAKAVNAPSEAAAAKRLNLFIFIPSQSVSKTVILGEGVDTDFLIFWRTV